MRVSSGTHVLEAHLHEEDLGVAGDLEYANVHDGEDLRHHTDGGTENPWKAQKEAGRVMKVMQVYTRGLEERRYRCGVCWQSVSK